MKDIVWNFDVLVTRDDGSTDSVSKIKDNAALGSTRTVGNGGLLAEVAGDDKIKQLLTDLGFTPSPSAVVASDITDLIWRLRVTATNGTVLEAGSSDKLDAPESNDLDAVKAELAADDEFVALVVDDLGGTV